MIHLLIMENIFKICGFKNTLKLKELKKTDKKPSLKKVISLKKNYLFFEAESTLSSFFTAFSLSSRCFS